MTFTGIPAEAFDFYEALAADNTKSFWADHKPDYETHVRAPMTALGDALTEEFGEPKLYRPYRDVRFSKDKTPYKDHQGMLAQFTNGLGWYLQLSAEGLMAAGGWYVSTPEQIKRYRERIGEDESGELDGLIDDLTAKGYLVDGEQLASRPRGIAPDHPRLQLLRFKTMHATCRWAPEPWMGTAEVVDRVRGAWSDYRPLMHYLAPVVGPYEPKARGARP